MKVEIFEIDSLLLYSLIARSLLYLYTEKTELARRRCCVTIRSIKRFQYKYIYASVSNESSTACMRSLSLSNYE